MLAANAVSVFERGTGGCRGGGGIIKNKAKRLSKLRLKWPVLSLKHLMRNVIHFIGMIISHVCFAHLTSWATQSFLTDCRQDAQKIGLKSVDFGCAENEQKMINFEIILGIVRMLDF